MKQWNPEGLQETPVLEGGSSSYTQQEFKYLTGLVISRKQAVGPSCESEENGSSDSLMNKGTQRAGRR